ncbi:MAG TPA: asparagine synthetase B, partial [Alphaproteobacteria bacterium]|nr:asparagine synthetase B [Alphaproteobacteria bacterium]
TYAEFRLRLPELLLMRVDKISMSTSVEGRVPFLDHNLVEFTMDIPQAWKVRGGETKYLLKKALEDLLPKDIIYRKKMGFGAPMADWLRGAFGRRAERTVLNSSLFDLGLLDRDHVAGLFRGHFDGRKDNALHLWALFNLAAWYDHWIAGASSN